MFEFEFFFCVFELIVFELWLMCDYVCCFMLNNVVSVLFNVVV